MELRDKFRRMHSAVKLWVIWMASMLDAGEALAEQWVEGTWLGDWEPTTRLGQRAQSQAVLTVVVIGIIIIIGILVYSEIETALPTPANNDLENASNNSTETFSDSMELAPVILLVLIASVILAVVQRFR